MEDNNKPVRKHRKNPYKSDTAPDLIEAIDREQEAVALRRQGLNYHEIAAAMGISVSGAHRCVVRAMEAAREMRDEETKHLVAMELDRLDTLQNVLWGESLSGNLLAMDRVFKIFERRAKLLGLDGAQKVALSADLRADIKTHSAPLDLSKVPDDVLAAYEEAQRKLLEALRSSST